MSTVIKVENISKQYRLGNVGLGSLSHDLNRWWYSVRGKENPYLKIGEENDRSVKGESEYVWALRDINFEVKQGEVLGIIGRNGAGKSTLLKILSRTTTPTTGQVKIKGRVASLLEVGTGFHPDLTGRENIFLNGAILGMTKKEIKNKFDEIVNFAGVERYIDTPVKRYSSGMYVRLAFAVAAHLDPEVLIIDEVLAVGDSNFQKKAMSKMKNISVIEGKTVLLVSHNISAIQKLCENAIVLKNGKIEGMGDVKKIIDRYLTGERDFLDKDLEKLKNRSGNQKAVFSKVYVENQKQEVVNRISTGDDIKIVIKLKIKDKNISNLNIGFSLHNASDEMYTCLYSGFQSTYIKPGEKEYLTIKFKLRRFPFADKKLYIKGRILADEIECDWPSDPLCEIEINDGDYYMTGSIINSTTAPFLINGEWELM